MNEKNRKILAEAGVDIEDAMSRFMDNEALMLKVLRRFTEDDNFRHLKQAMEKKDAARAFEAAHTLKGLTGNLSLKDLYRETSILTEDLRSGDIDGAAEKMTDIDSLFQKTVAILSCLDE